MLYAAYVAQYALFFFLEIAPAFLMENIILSDLCGCRS